MSLSIYAGDDAVLTATVYTDDTLTTPKNLTGLLMATFMLKTHVDDLDAAALITKKLASGITVTNAAGGVLAIALDAADTVALATATLYAALKLKDSSGKTVTVYSSDLALTRPAVRVAV